MLAPIESRGWIYLAGYRRPFAATLFVVATVIRARRRERAIAFANALPVKRLFPLVICFLPGLFVWTLGPAFVQLFKLTETFTRGGGL